MSSLNENSALTRRRPSRRQPLRRCKRFRGNPGGGPFLMDITEPVMRHILGFTMWDDEENDCLTLWKWTGELGIVCQDFRRVARKVAPEKLTLNLEDPRAVALLETFLDTPWKREKLIGLKCTLKKWNIDGCLTPFLRLFHMPGSLPNLTQLQYSGNTWGKNAGTINADFLNNLARACPLLSDLHLHVDNSTTPITSEESGNFGELLQQPLNKCHMYGILMTAAHLDAFLRHQGQSLIHLDLHCDAYSPLSIIARHCSQLEKLAVRSNLSFSVFGFSSLLQANEGLRELNVLSPQTESVRDEVIDGLNQYAPQLERICFVSCYWFTDECLERLVQGQLDYWSSRRESIPLFAVDARYTRVSRAGVERVLAKPNVGNLGVNFNVRNSMMVLSNYSESQ